MNTSLPRLLLFLVSFGTAGNYVALWLEPALYAFNLSDALTFPIKKVKKHLRVVTIYLLSLSPAYDYVPSTPPACCNLLLLRVLPVGDPTQSIRSQIVAEKFGRSLIVLTRQAGRWIRTRDLLDRCLIPFDTMMSNGRASEENDGSTSRDRQCTRCVAQ